MKTLVALLSLASVALAHWMPAVPQDTHEVAAAKAAHFAAHAAARGHVWTPHVSVYAGHWAYPTIGPDGTPLDTPEVALAKANHMAAVAAAGGAASSSWNDDGQWHGEGLWESGAAGAGAWAAYGHGAKWTGPIALPSGYDHNGAPLPVHDTPEVAAAKANHLAILNGARAAAGAGAGVGAGVGAGAGAWSAYGHGAKWTGPIALPPGYDHNGAPLPVLDTPEVAVAKANHLAILNGAHAGAGAAHGWNDGQWHSALWGDHGRYRRSAVVLARTPASTVPIVHAPVITPIVHSAPLVRSWGYSTVTPAITHVW